MPYCKRRRCTTFVGRIPGQCLRLCGALNAHCDSGTGVPAIVGHVPSPDVFKCNLMGCAAPAALK